MDKNSLVVKSNALIETSYRLTTNEQRIVLACISQIRRDEQITDQKKYSVSAQEISSLCGANIKTAYRDLKVAALKLKRREVRISQEANGYGKRKKTLVTGWVQSIEYSDGDGVVSLRFNHDILPYLSELNKNFTSYKLKNVVKMSSSYGTRIYELLVQWGGLEEREISMEKLRKILLLEDKYKPISNFKARVLAPAIKDINENSDLSVTYTQKKKGRKVTHLIFKFKSKEELKRVVKYDPKIQGIRKSVIEKNGQVVSRLKNKKEVEQDETV
jgi:plasmid replication initiation protein